MNSLLLTFAVLIVASLSSYAIFLALKLNKAKKELLKIQQIAEQKLKDHQHELIQDINFIARAMLSEQCEITEGVMRLSYLLNTLDSDVWQDDALKAIRFHHMATADMPILEAYQALTKQQQFALDNRRYQLEADHKDAILKELEWLVIYQFPSITLLH